MNSRESVRIELEGFRWFDPQQISDALNSAETERLTWFVVDPCFPILVRCDGRGTFEVLNEG
jgi:hypothetical protein